MLIKEYEREVIIYTSKKCRLDGQITTNMVNLLFDPE